jgi:hypothetical protein
MLVLAMEFSRGARYLDSKLSWRLAERIRERPTVSNRTVGIATGMTMSLPQNGIVRSGVPSRPEYGAGHAHPRRDMGDRQPPGNERKPNNQ